MLDKDGMGRWCYGRERRTLPPEGNDIESTSQWVSLWSNESANLLIYEERATYRVAAESQNFGEICITVLNWVKVLSYMLHIITPGEKNAWRMLFCSRRPKVEFKMVLGNVLYAKNKFGNQASMPREPTQKPSRGIKIKLEFRLRRRRSHAAGETDMTRHEDVRNGHVEWRKGQWLL